MRQHIAQSAAPVQPGSTPYPEQRTSAQQHPLQRRLPRRKLSQRRLQRLSEQVQQHLQTEASISVDELSTEVAALRPLLRSEGLSDELAIRAFALVCHAARLQLGMTPRKVQVMGAWAILRGNLAEMQTGEGKTLTATLPAASAALAGLPVHVITANDYLAERDAQIMQPIYQALGLSVSAISTQMNDAQRRDAYAADVTYCSSQQLCFDYLRDRVILREAPGALRLSLESLYPGGTRVDSLMLRGLCFAIVDEADSVLIDEARTPLLLSRPGDSKLQKSTLVTALFLARRLKQGQHYKVDLRHRQIQLSNSGERELARHCESLRGLWQGRRRRQALVTQALSALHLFLRDRDYLLREDRVEIIDSNTGRGMPDRAWEHELHALIELKEGLKPSGQRENIARLTYQRFFRRYLALAGMSGTASEVAREFKRVYRLSVVRIPTHKPPQRRNLGLRFYPSQEAQAQAIIERVREMVAAGRAVLIGSRSVAESEYLAAQLSRQYIPYQLLNARQDRHEAEIIAQAGQPAQITLATNMAGRGTDIDLHASVIRQGGLHVISTSVNDAARIDRQLFGRAGRQGQPGSHECLLCQDDELLQRYIPKPARHWLALSAPKLLLRLAQRAEEQYQAHLRARLVEIEDQLQEQLAFSGSGE